MSIGINRNAPVLPTAVMQPATTSSTGSAGAGGVARSLPTYNYASDPNELYNLLTPSDLALFASMYGPDALTKGINRDGSPFVVPDLVRITAVNRQSGFLAPGKEMDATYIQTMWDQYANYDGPADGRSNPLTKTEFDAAMDFFKNRDHNKVDVRA
jgi:hypothetical protein